MRDISTSVHHQELRQHQRSGDVGEGSSTGTGPKLVAAEGPRYEKRKRSPRLTASEDEYLHTPWLDNLRPRQYESVEQKLHTEIVAYMSYVLPTPQETTARQKVFSHIEKVVKRRFWDGEVKIFGSAATGLCLPTGDIDVVISTKEANSPAEKRRQLFQLSAMLKSARLTWDVQVNHRARVPIIIFETLPDFGSFSVDIGLNNVDGLQAIDVVNDYLSKMPALRPLILVLKGFLSQRKLNNAANAGLSSYALTILVISFLQLNPSQRPADFIDKPMETESLGALLIDFLFYYGVSFPYTTSYISATQGKVLLKSSAEWINTRVPDRLAIQCLIQPENDVGKSAGRIEAIRSAFKKGYTTLLQLTVEDSNILGSVVALNQTTLDHRNHIRSIVDSGKLDTAISPPRHRYSRNLPPALATLPTRPDPHGAPIMSPDTNPSYYGSAFGSGSAMGRDHRHLAHSGRGYNRKGSGFQLPVLPLPQSQFSASGSDGTRKQNQAKRRRIEV